MSIFQIKELWGTNVGNSEEFDRNSICIGNIDSSSPPEMKIAVGSFEGVLRVFKPQTREFKVSDMILEKNLGLPILQIDCGKFSFAADYCLAILHSRKLVVASVVSNEEFATYRVLYEHSFDRNAYNFISGAFGRNAGKQMICVQSVDGALFFFEHEVLVFQIQLPDFLIPGPLIYAANIDSIIITNSNLELECYRFSSLQAFTNNNITAQKIAQQQDAAKSKLEPDWVSNIGEQAQHLVYHSNKITKKPDVVVVGEQSFFILNENDGKIRYQRRLEYTPSCIKTYHVPAPGKDIFENEERTASQVLSSSQFNSPCFSFILGSFSHYLMVYKDVQLVWTAKTQTAPIYVNIAKIESQEGLIVTFSDNGYLQVVYLGTETPVSATGAPIQDGLQEMNYEQMDLEHQRLLARIRNHEDEKQVEPQDKLTVTSSLSSIIEQSSEYIEDPTKMIARNEQGKAIRMKLKLTLSFKGGSASSVGVFKNVQIQVQLPPNVYSEQTLFKYENLNFAGRATPPVLQLYLFPTKKCSPIDSLVTVTCTYQQVNSQNSSAVGGNLRSTIAEVQLPMAFFVSIGQEGASKEANDIKINLILNKTAPSAVSLFEDVIESLQARELCAQGNKKQLTFVYHNKIPCSILISKDDLKVRLQSPDFCSIWFVLNQLIIRLQSIYGSSEDFEVTYQDAIPLNELFNSIDEHYGIRVEIARLKKVLEDRSLQFRIIQKRLLNRFKDKNPSPLNNLDFLLNHTYMQIVESASMIEELQKQLKASSLRLSSAIEIILILLKIRFKMTGEEYEILKMHFSPSVDDESEHGWEDVTNAAMTSLLKTCLAKAGKSSATNVSSQIKSLQDVGKLKQHITLVCDRISKGAKIEL